MKNETSMNDLCVCQSLAGPTANLSPRCFGHVWFFAGLPPEAWQSISGHLIRKRLSAGEELFRQGDRAESMYLIKAGSVKLWKLTEEGRNLTLDLRKSGDLLGESVLLEDQADYPVGATCLEPTLTCGISRPLFEQLVMDFPSVGLIVIRNLSQRIQNLSGKVGALSEPNLEDRLYEVLANVAREVGTRVAGGWTIAFPLTHEEIGFLVGAHRVSVTRALGKLRELGKIATEGKQLFVSESPALS